MAKVTWLGEDDLHPEDDRGGPTFTIWNGVKFPKGEAVEVTDPKAIEVAKGNQFFEVEDGEDPPKKEEAPDDESEEGDEDEEEEADAPDAPLRTAPKRATTRRRK